MKQKVALVLSGGAARGIAHIGVIEELIHRNYEIASVSGTSMGALVGGVFAAGKLDEFKKWVCALDKLKIFSLIDFTFSTQGLIKGDKVLNAIKKYVNDVNIEELSIPYCAVAADIVHKQEVVFRSGNMFDAIRASIAIPTVFTPVKKGKMLIVDGGVINNIPVDRVTRNEGDLLFAVNVNANVDVTYPDQEELHKEKRHSVYLEKMKNFQQQLHKLNPLHKEMGYFDLVTNTITFMMYQNEKLSLQKTMPDLLIETAIKAYDLFDFYKAPDIIAYGRNEAAKALDQFEGKD